MQGRDLFEYAVIRVVPRVEREEFLNVGVVLYCRDQKFMEALIELDKSRVSILHHQIDMEDLGAHLHSFGRICTGGEDAGPIAALPLAERFRWLTAKRSTVIQTSPVHPGLCLDARETLQRLFDQLVR